MGTDDDGNDDAERNKPPQMISRADVAQVVFNQLKEAERAAFEVASGYGRWLIASLVLAHGGGLVGVFGLFKETVRDSLMAQRAASAAWWLVAGLMLALATGFVAWLNWGLHAENYRHRATPQMLWDPGKWENPPIHVKSINFTYWISMVVGVASGACIIGAAWSLLSGSPLTQTPS